MNACIPSHILGPTSCLVKRQKRIESISILTSKNCASGSVASYVLDFAPFANLRDFSWKNARRAEHYESIRKCLIEHGKALKTLSLDLRWPADIKRNCPVGFLLQQSYPIKDDFLTNVVLPKDFCGAKVLLSCLESLSFSALDLHSFLPGIFCALDVSKLTVMKLYDCIHSLDFLGAMATWVRQPRLKVFELVVAVNELGSKDLAESLGEFLNAFQGLETLYLMLPQQLLRDVVIQGILNHKLSLVRLVAQAWQRLHMTGCVIRMYPDSFDTLRNKVAHFLDDTRLKCIEACVEDTRLVIPSSRSQRREQADRGYPRNCTQNRYTAFYISNPLGELKISFHTFLQMMRVY